MYKNLVENRPGNKIKALRSDNGGEYVNSQFQNFLADECIRHERTVPCTPQQNGVSENLFLLNKVRCMLSDANASKGFWGEVLANANYLRNRTPSRSINFVTPFQKLHGHIRNIKHLRVFGCTAYVHIPSEDRNSKLDSRSHKCVLVGYGEKNNGYRLWDPTSRKIIHARNVIFNEAKSEFALNVCRSNSTDINVTSDTHNQQIDGLDIINEYNDLHVNATDNIETTQLRRSIRTRKPPDMYGEWAFANKCDLPEPKSVNEALNSSESIYWQKTMQEEIDSVNDNNVWTLADLPKNRKPIAYEWIFKRKIDIDGKITCYKARLVAQEFAQVPGEDCDETFSPAVKFDSIRTLIGLAAQNNWSIHQMDVTTAFLNGELSEEVYLEQPAGFIVSGREDQVCHLTKSLYGLKQSPKCWNDTLCKALNSMGFVEANGDPCIFVKHCRDNICFLGIYVDDLILVSLSNDVVIDFKKELCSKFKMKDIGMIKYFLGVKISTNNSGYFMSQELR